jgi:hypothetical protein
VRLYWNFNLKFIQITCSNNNKIIFLWSNVVCTVIHYNYSEKVTINCGPLEFSYSFLSCFIVVTFLGHKSIAMNWQIFFYVSFNFTKSTWGVFSNDNLQTPSSPSLKYNILYVLALRIFGQNRS